MICSKCTSEIPDSAKFCPVCGQKCEPAPLFCTNCGLELKAGSKFCSVCGTPVGAKEAKPETMGYAGNVDAPASASESLVAAMPAVSSEMSAESAGIPEGIPVPVNSAPANVGFGVPTPVNDVSSAVTAPVASAPSVFASAPAEETAQKVSLAKPGSEPAPADFGDMGFSSAAAVAVTPIKKHNSGKIAIIVGAAVVAVLAVLTVVFLLNKGPIMNMFMGDSRYASMIEGSGLRSVSELADNPAIAQGIRSASASYAASAAAYNSYDTDYAAHTVMTHDTDAATQFAAMLEQYQSTMLETYGVNSLSVKLNTDITVTDTAKALLFSDYTSDEEKVEFDRALAALNSTTLTYDITADKDAAMFGVEMTEGGLTINAQAFMLSDGTVYLCFPFGSDKVIKYVMKEGEVVSAEEAPTLEFDEKEISRLIDEIVNIYLKYYENSDIVITPDGELFAGDAKAHGTLITATMSGELIKDMAAEIGKHIAEDTYFSDKIIEYVKECGMELDLDEYKEDITDAFDIDVSNSIVISSVVDKNNNVLGKRYSSGYDKSEEFTQSSSIYSYTEDIFFGYVESSDVFAAEFGYLVNFGYEDNMSTDEFNASALVRKTSETDGSVSLKLRVDDESYAANIEYSDVKTEKFLGNDVCTGTYTLTVTPPADFTKDISSSDAAILAALSASKFTLSSNVNGGAYECSFGVDVPQYGSIALNTSMSGSDSKVTVPSGDTIEISDTLAEYLSSYNFIYGYAYGYDGTKLSEADKAVMEELSDLFGALKDKAASSDSYFAQYIAEALGESSQRLSEVPEPTADFNGVSALMDRMYDDLSAIDEVSGYPNIDGDLKSRCDGLYDKLKGLYSDVSYGMKQEEYDRVCTQLEEYEETIAYLLREAAEASAVTAAAPSSRDFDTMSYNELVEAYYDISYDYILAYYSAYELVESDDSFSKLNKAVEEAYSKVEGSIESLSSSLDGGNLSVPKLRTLRSDMAAFETAVNAFVNAVEKLQ